jgi:hypothetical protein
MIYKILKKSRGLLTEATPCYIDKDCTVEFTALNALPGSELYLSIKEKMVKASKKSDEVFVIAIDDFAKLGSMSGTVNLTLINENKPLKTWALDPLVAVPTSSGGVILYADDNALRQTVATLTQQVFSLTSRVSDAEKKVSEIYKQFDDTYVTE